MNLYVNLVNTIIQHYFLNSRCIILFTDEFNTIDYAGNVPVINVKIESTADSINWSVIFRYFGCQEVVVKSGRPLWIFKTFENKIRLNMERFNSRKYLFVPGKNMTENLTDIFQMKELQYVTDLVVIEEYEHQMDRRKRFWSHENITCHLWTHRYGGESDNNEKLLLDVWFSKNQSFRYERNLYPNKLLNQMGRELRMATFQYEPYSIIGSTVDEYYGSEMSSAVMFARKFNMTPVAIVNPEDYWGEIFDNWTGNGLLGNIAMDRADLGFSALYTWEVDYHFLDLSKPLVRTGITCLVPAPTLAPGWLTPLYSYSSAMWIAVGIMLIVCILSLFFIHYFYAKTKCSNTTIAQKSTPYLLGRSVFSIVKLFVLQVVSEGEIPRGFNGTYFMGLLYLLSLFLTSTYSSGLSTVMTIPRYENPINTVQEFVGSGIYWGATQEAWITSIKKVEEPTYQTIVRHFVPTSEENLRDYSKNGKFAFSLERLPHENYAIGTYIQEDVIGNFHLMREDLYWEQCVIMTRKNSVLLNLLDTFILQVFEAGLISYWQNKAVDLYMDTQVQRVVKFYYHGHGSEHKLVKLNWTHVEGAFGILCIGYIISFTVFLIELIVDKLKSNVLTENSIQYMN